MNIICKVVPNEEVKLRAGFTGADWWWEADGTKWGLLQVRVASEIEDPAQIASLEAHEISEAIMCRYSGITHQKVDVFDSAYQRTHSIDLNSGDEPDCPYRLPHTFATAIERILTGYQHVDWKAYDDKLSKI
jgi:hypothetical protein